MKKEFQIFKTEMDSWVKQFNNELSGYNSIPNDVEENTENIDHNYELLHELRAEITRLKEEVSALRIVQLLYLKSELKNPLR